MNPEDIKALIDQLLKTGEILATKSFELATKQIYVYAILDVIIGILLFFGGLLIYKAIRKYYGDDYNFEHSEGMFSVLSWIVSTMGVILCISSLKFFLNPEWYAVKLLIETFFK